MSQNKRLEDMIHLETAVATQISLFADHHKKKSRFEILANLYLDIDVDSIREGVITITDEIKKQIMFLSEFYAADEEELDSIKKFVDNIDKITIGDLENAIFKSVDSVSPELMDELLAAWNVFAKAVVSGRFETPAQKKWLNTRRFKLKQAYKKCLANDQLRYGNAFVIAEEKSIMLLEKSLRVLDYYQRLQNERIDKKYEQLSKGED